MGGANRMAVLAVLVLCFRPLARAEQPHFVNATLETRSGADLSAAFDGISRAETKPAWVAYSVPAAPGRHFTCCGDSEHHGGVHDCCRCRLERGENVSLTQDDGHSVKLEGNGSAAILIRVENRRPEKVRVLSPDCELDAGGLRVYWLTGVKPDQSVALLASFVKAGRQADDKAEANGRLGDGALTAIAVHAGDAADHQLETFAAAGHEEKLREHAAFWLGCERGRFGYEVLSRLVRSDSSDGFREKAVFALYVSKEPQAVDALIGAAHNDKSPRVRGQALFWLAQKASNKAASAIVEAIQSDTETEVKKKAVFALSQLPKDEGVPKLIEVARNNRNPEVRKQAMFWLGQSNDPRALEFFTQVLSH